MIRRILLILIITLCVTAPRHASASNTEAAIDPGWTLGICSEVVGDTKRAVDTERLVVCEC